MTTYYTGSLTSTPVTQDGYSVGDYDSTDVFHFSLDYTQNVNLGLTDIIGGDADLSLYQDSNYNGVLDGSDTFISSSVYGGTHDDAINQQLGAGNYLVQVSRYSGSYVNYDLNMSATWSYSPGNILATETDLGDLWTDTTQYGSVGSTDTSDIYAFSLDFYEGVNISMTGLSTDADIRLIQDYNNNNQVDTGEVLQSSTAGGSISEYLSSVDLSGNYLLQVYQYSGNTNYQVNFDHYTTSYA